MLYVKKISLENKLFVKVKLKQKKVVSSLWLFFTKNKLNYNENDIYINGKKFDTKTYCYNKELLKFLFLMAKNLGFNFTVLFFVKGGGWVTKNRVFEICLNKALRLISEKFYFIPIVESGKFELKFKRKERKKAGLKKARKGPQYHKR